MGIPPERAFETKIPLGLKMIRRAQAQGLPFEWVACDTLYGRDRPFHATLATLGLGYAVQVPATTPVYLHPPQVGLPVKPNGWCSGARPTANTPTPCVPP